MRPRGVASLRISPISASLREKSKIDMFSLSRSILEVRGMTIAPSCTRKRKHTWPAVFLCAAPMVLSVRSLVARPRAIGL